MIKKRLADIEEQDIRDLIADRVREGRTLDYKQELPGNRPQDKKKFLAAVSSFANAIGGQLMYGIEEQRDADGNSTGLPEEAVGVSCNIDQELLRLKAMIRTGIDPTLLGVDVEPVGADWLTRITPHR